ncbi:MAG: ribosome biogenesis GTP-binding protein YihA/YsxC [Ignavibacteriaceae bacterium]
MFDKQEFIKSVYNVNELPKENLPEIILCGRSNVGKSSFINSLFNRKNLAKISSTPGKTRSINYYLIDDKFYIVDLPGYGYAKASKKEREFWGKLVGDFISGSKNIFFAFHLVDSRHKPTELDIGLNDLLRFHEIPYIVLLSKIDKLNQSELSSAKKEIKKAFPELLPGENLMIYSSVKNTGRKEVLSRLVQLTMNN